MLWDDGLRLLQAVTPSLVCQHGDRLLGAGSLCSAGSPCSAGSVGVRLDSKQRSFVNHMMAVRSCAKVMCILLCSDQNKKIIINQYLVVT